jgi:predicted nucleic acid-binding protein
VGIPTVVGEQENHHSLWRGRLWGRSDNTEGTQSVTNAALVSALRQELDAGEAEAIVLTLETEAEMLLMDERVGREVARHLGLRFIGLIGVLVEAKHNGVLSAVKPHLDALRNVAGFRIRDALYARILENEGEESWRSKI